MYGVVFSACVIGIDGKIIEVEADINNGLPQFHIVGLPDSSVRESMERVRASIKNCKFTFPMERITVNLAPADLRKEGVAFDLAIAAGILLCSGQLAAPAVHSSLVIGELALDGSVRPVNGVLPMVQAARQAGLRRVILPASNVSEAMLIEGIEVKGITHLSELVSDKETAPFRRQILPMHNVGKGDAQLGALTMPAEDYADVRGQHHAKRAFTVAAAGMHNIMLIGPPGSGKTMLARRLPSIMPPLTDEEALEVTKIYSVAGEMTSKQTLIRKRPFRSPHHTVSQAGLVGGGSIPKPGEVSLAHSGVLFLDEVSEFTRHTLEVLRQPLEDRHVTIGRAKAVYTFPARLMLAVSLNPCPCGYFGAETDANPCRCSPMKIERYRAKLSGPLLDRIDLHVEVPRIEYADLTGESKQELSSDEMRQCIVDAQAIQAKRFANDGITYNSELSGRLLRKYCRLTAEAETVLAKSFDVLSLSVRAHDRILKLARTIADLERADHIVTAHIAEAIHYRSLDRKWLLNDQKAFSI